MSLEWRHTFLIAAWPLFLALGVLLLGVAGQSFIDHHNRRSPELIAPVAVAASPSGDVFVYDLIDSRVLCFTRHGDLHTSWRVPAYDGLARLRWSNGRIEVATVRNGLLLQYSPEGSLISKQENASAYWQFPEDRSTMLQDGSVVQLEDQALVHIAGQFKSVWVGARPLPLRSVPLRYPIPLVAVVPGIVGIVIAWALWRVGRQEAAQPFASGVAASRRH